MRAGRLLLFVAVMAPLAFGEQPAVDGPPPSVAPEVLARDEKGRATVRAVRLAEPLVVDGRLDDSAYTQVKAINEFIQQEPLEGGPSSERSEAWIFFDDRNLFSAQQPGRHLHQPLPGPGR